MAHKVIDVTRYKDHYDELSKTPKNYAKDNYFLKELQDKVDAEWKYRPNRVDIEYEAIRGTLERAREKHYGDDKSIWRPIEVVIQSVKSEKGTAISNDCRRIVFKNILEKRFNIGSKFRFTPDYENVGDRLRAANMESHPAIEGLDFDYEVISDDETNFFDDNNNGVYTSDSEITKNVWLSTNMDQVKMTASCIIERCNGTLISSYVDAQNVTHYHSEPVIQGMNLSSVSMFYNDTAVLPQGELLIIAQHNDFTRDYKINQRFVIGYDRVYRIKAINKFYSNSTNDPYDVGLIRIYMELTEISPYDNFEKRIAYQDNQNIIVPETTEDSTYSIVFTSPDKIPDILEPTATVFTPIVIDNKGNFYPNIPIDVSYSLENLPTAGKINAFIDYDHGEDDGQKWYSFAKKKMYLNGSLIITCHVSAADSPTTDGFTTTISIKMH